MPAGVTWPMYLRFSVAAFLSMLMGAQCVHLIYNPLSDLEKVIEEEKGKLKKMTTDRVT